MRLLRPRDGSTGSRPARGASIRESRVRGRFGLGGWWLLAWAWTLLAPASAGAVCQLQTSGNWGPVSVFTGATNCAALDGSEEIQIPAGVTVRVVADVVQPALPGEAVRVLSGGTLRVRGAERSGGRGPLRVALTPKGLVCAAGAQCFFEGVYRQVGVAHPAPQATLAGAGWLAAGEVVPCPGFDADAGIWVPDCAGDLTGAGDFPGSSDEVGFVYPPGAPTTPPFAAAVLDAMEPGDVLCFGDPDPSTPSAPVDDGFCYEITLVDGALGGAGILKIDIRQTNPARPRDTTYRFSLRRVREGSLLGGTAPGGRIAVVDPGVLAGTRLRERVGMWLRFADAEGAPRQDSYKIVRSWNNPPAGQAPVNCPGGPGTCDVLEIYDPRGFADEQDAGDTLWIDYGHARGEPFFVMAPVTLTEADGVQEPDKGLTVDVLGGATFGAVLVDDTAGLRLFGAELLRFEDVWLRDVTAGGAGNGVALTLLHLEGVLRRVSLTGGNASGSGGDRIHSVGLGTYPSTLAFRNLSIRHHGDDGLTHSASVILDVERYRLEWSTPGAQSCNLIGQNSPAGVLSGEGRDLLCQDCNRAGHMVRTQPAIDFPLRGIARWGSVDSFDSQNTLGLPVEDLLQVGGGGRLPWRVERFVVAHESGVAVLGGGVDSEVRDGIVRDTSVSQRNVLSEASSGILENVVLLDVDTTRACAGECAVLRLTGDPPAAMLVRDVTVALSEGATTRFNQGVEASATGSGFSVDGLLVSGMSRAPSTGYGIGGAAAGTALVFGDTAFGPLLHDNDVHAQSPGSLPPSAVVGVDPGFVDTDAGRFDTAPGSAADLAQAGIRRGVAAPGLRYGWIHAITRTPPERMAEDPDGDGVPTDLEAAPCRGGATTECSDNCPGLFNPSQVDADENGAGDDCAASCSDGLDNDGDGLVDYPGDPGCASSVDASERSSLLPCDDGVDNDLDGESDYVADEDGDGISDPPGDIGCGAPTWSTESPACADGINNDPQQDGRIDWDGGASAGVPPGSQTAPDPQCVGYPWRRNESITRCGLGFEVVLLVPLLSLLRRRRAR